MRFFAIVIVCSLLVVPAYGQKSTDSFTAASLYAVCTHSVSDATTEKDREDLETICTSYFRGLTDALFVMQSLHEQGTRTCLPINTAISIQEARTTFEGWMREHPNTATNSAGLVAAMSLVYAHKCN